MHRRSSQFFCSCRQFDPLRLDSLFSCSAKRYATIVVVRFSFLNLLSSPQRTNRGLNSPNKHGGICSLGHKFILNLNFSLNFNFILNLKPYLSQRRPINLQKFSINHDISVSPKYQILPSPHVRRNSIRSGLCLI